MVATSRWMDAGRASASGVSGGRGVTSGDHEGEEVKGASAEEEDGGEAGGAPAENPHDDDEEEAAPLPA